MNILSHFIFLISLSCPLLDTKAKIANSSLISPVINHEKAGTISVGAIFNGSSTSVKVAQVAIEMVIYDFYFTRNRSLLLHFQNSQGKPGPAALEAEDPISTYGVKAILGARKQDDASAIAEAVTDESHDHVLVFLSFSDSIPTTLTFTWVLRATPRQQVQMNATAAIVQSWGLHQVTLIYEKASALSSPELIIFSQLSQAFQQSGGELSHSSLQKELTPLKKHKHRVLVILATVGSGYPLYQLAKNLNITGAGCAWITTDSITYFFRSVGPKKMSSMQDNIGTKTFFPENRQEFHNFRKKYRPNFSNNPDEEHDEPSIFASQADDPVRALLLKPNITNSFQIISAADPGAKLQFFNWKKFPAEVLEIVNIIGKNYRSFNTSWYYKIDKEILWPAQRRYTQSGLHFLTSRSESIRVGVPAQSMFPQFVKVETDPKTNVTSYDGFSLKVFEEAMKIADVNKLRFEYHSFSGDYDDLVEQIALGKFDAVAGDVTILGERHKYADFSQAYTESGVVLVVPIRSRTSSQMWLFMNPFTTELWGLILAITIYTGFIVWLIERNHNPEFRSGTIWNQIGTLFWPASRTLLTSSADNLRSKLSRMAMVVWLFVALILAQSYTSILSSMLTAQRLAPATKDVQRLASDTEYVDTDMFFLDLEPYKESEMDLVVPVRFGLPIRMRHIDRMRGHTETRRRILTSRSEPIRVGVPAHSMFQQFVKVETDPKTNVTSYDGFSLKVFEEVMKIADVNNGFTYNYYSFNGGYDDLVKQIALGKFDIVAGDVTILEERHKYADFSRAYTEPGMVLVVPTRSRLPIQMWILLNPFTRELWGLVLAITIYNGFIVWLIERNQNPEFRSSTVWNQIGTLFWPASTTLFTWSVHNLRSNLSRMVMVVWLFVALILAQSYMSILSSMLTAQRLAPATKDVATLKKMNATVGYCRGSFLRSYMINALGFNPAMIKKYSSTLDYAKALKTGEIAGIFLEVPSANLFLAQYCKSFMKTEQVFKVGGYGFAFKKDFPLLPDINNAILKISENGKLLELEERYFDSKECVEPVLFSNDDASIGSDSFAILFVLTGCTSTVALAIYVIKYIICSLFSTPVCSNLLRRVSAFIKKWRNYTSESSAIVIIVENPGNLPEASYSEARQHILQHNY